MKGEAPAGACARGGAAGTGMAYTRPMVKRTPAGLPRALGALVLLLCAGFAAPVTADAPAPVPTATQTLAVQPRAGFDGFYKVGGWLPVFALAANAGPPVEGRLALAPTGADALSGNYGVAATLPTRSQKQLFFAAPALSAERSRTLTLTADGRTILTQALTLSPLSPQDYLYGVVSPDGGALNALRGLRQFDGTVNVAHLTLGDLPAAGPALGDLDVLVLDDVSTAALTPEQRQTLEAWLGAGGQLVLSGGSGAARTVAGLPELAPVTAGGTTVVDAGAALAPWTGQSGPEPTTAALGRPHDGSLVRLRAGDIPLVVDRPYGSGWVTFLALPASTPTLRDGPGAAAAWGHILTSSRHDAGGPRVGSLARGPGSPNAVYALPEAVLPSGRLLFWLIAGYILVVGPVNYLLLRRLDRRELLWATIPVASLLFSGGAYLLASELKGSQVVVNSVAIVRSEAGAPVGALDGAVGIFSPGRTSYDLRLGGGVTVLPLALDTGGSSGSGGPVPATTAEGQDTLLQGVRVEKWSMQAFAVRGSSAGAPPLEASLSLAGSTMTGWVRNRGARPLEDVQVAVGDDRASLATLAPGQQQNVRLVLSGPTAMLTRPSGPMVAVGSGSVDQRSRQALLDSALGNRFGPGGPASFGQASGPQVLAFSREAPFPVTVPGHRAGEHDLVLYVMHVPVVLGPGPRALPYAFARRELLQNTGVSQQFEAPWLPLGSTAVFQFRLPSEEIGTTWSALRLRLSLSGAGRIFAPAPIGVALYNWSSGAWDTQPRFGPGVNTLAQPAAYIDSRGYVRLQLSGGNGQQQVQALDLAADGAAG